MRGIGALAVVFCLLTGCGMRAVAPPQGADRAFAYGNIWIDEEYIPTCLVLFDEDGTRYSALTYTNGSYFVENLPPGRYVVGWFCARGDMYVTTTMENHDEHLFDVRPGELRYLGSWRVTTKRRFLASDKFDIQLVEEPHPREILTGLLPHLRGSGWDVRVQAALETPAAAPPPPAPTSGAPAAAPAPEPVGSPPAKPPPKQDKGKLPAAI